MSEDEFIFIHVGRQEFQKGHIVLLKALKIIENELPGKRISFLMCGRDGNATASIKSFLSENPPRINIIWLGHRSDIPRLLVASDMFVFPSLYEGLGGSLIEAQAAGLPVICSDLSVFNEVVKPGVNAYTFKTSSEGSLSKTIINAVSDLQRLESMRRESINNFENKFQIDNINRVMLTHYQKFHM